MDAPLGYRFGEFEVRLREQILLRNGKSAPIQQIPFQMLVFLLENDDRVVSREELQNRLWDGQTHLQFENGLHVVAAKLREALGEQASSPVYIKTISRKGYKFIGEADAITDPQSLAIQLEKSQFVVDVGVVPSLCQRWWKLAVGACGVLVLISIAVFTVNRVRHVTVIDPQQRVLIGSFTNDTHDPELDAIFNVPFQSKIRESQFLNLVASETSQDFSRLLGKPSIDAELSGCIQKKAQFLLNGHLEQYGQGYRVILSALRCDNGHVITSQTEVAATQLTILPALGQAAENLRLKLGEPEAVLGRTKTPIVQATTNSMVALRAFTMGEAKRTPATVTEAISYYKIATDLDPQFAMAYARLGVCYSWHGDDALSKQSFAAAFRLRDRSTDRERLYIASRYYYHVTGEIPQGIKTDKLWLEMFPNDAEPKNSLAVRFNNDLGQPEKAIEQSTVAVTLSPGNVAFNTTLAQAHLLVGDYAYLNSQCVNPAFPGMRAPTFHELCYESYFAQGDEIGMKREVESAQTPIQKSVVLTQSAWAAASQGRALDARKLFQQASKYAIENQTPDFAAESLMEQAFVEAETGMKEEAKLDVLEAVKEDFLNAKTQGLGALVLAKCGDSSGPRAMSLEAISQSPADSILNFTILGSMRAVLALNAGDAPGALKALEESRPYDFNTSTNLAPAYYRGLAYEKGRNWKAAADEFKTILNRRAIQPNSMFVPLAKLELGHVLVEMGDWDRASKIFTELDLCWKNADKNFTPLLRLKVYKLELKTSRSAKMSANPQAG